MYTPISQCIVKYAYNHVQYLHIYKLICGNRKMFKDCVIL